MIGSSSKRESTLYGRHLQHPGPVTRFNDYVINLPECRSRPGRGAEQAVRRRHDHRLPRGTHLPAAETVPTLGPGGFERGPRGGPAEQRPIRVKSGWPSGTAAARTVARRLGGRSEARARRRRDSADPITPAARRAGRAAGGGLSLYAAAACTVPGLKACLGFNVIDGTVMHWQPPASVRYCTVWQCQESGPRLTWNSSVMAPDHATCQPCPASQIARAI